MILGPLLLFWNPAQALVRRWPFIYCILPRTIYSWIQYLDLRGKNEIEKRCFRVFNQKAVHSRREREQGLQTWPQRACWLKCHYLKDSRHLHYFAWASLSKWLRAGVGKHCFFQFLKTILSPTLGFTCFGVGAGRCCGGEKVTDFQKVKDSFFPLKNNISAWYYFSIYHSVLS